MVSGGDRLMGCCDTQWDECIMTAVSHLQSFHMLSPLVGILFALLFSNFSSFKLI